MLLPGKDTVFITGTIKPNTAFDPLFKDVWVTMQAVSKQLVFTATLPGGCSGIECEQQC
jgi:hypothetical protein